MSKPISIFLIGGPGSGKDYVLSNIFSRFDLTEVQIDHILNGSANELLEQKKNIVINGSIDADKITIVNSILEGYDVDYVYVSVTNKVSRLRNSLRENPLAENKRIDKFLRAEKLAESIDCFTFNNSINLNESCDFEKVFFADQIEKLLSRLVNHGLEMQEIVEVKTFAPVPKHKSGLPKKYVAGLSDRTAAARKTHWKKMSKYSDRDSRAYKPAPGDLTAKTKLSKYTKKYHAMYGEQVEGDLKRVHSVEDIAAKHKVAVADIIQALTVGKQVEKEHTNDDHTAETIALAHLWEKPDYYTLLAKMEQKIPPTIKVTDAEHQTAERKDQIRRDRRDWRLLHHQNRHIRQAAKASMSEAEDKPLPAKLRKAPRSGNITQVMDKRKETGRVDEDSGERNNRYFYYQGGLRGDQINKAVQADKEHERRVADRVAKRASETPKKKGLFGEGAADTSLAAKAKKSGISVGTLRKVYNRGVAAWNSGHRPGTTPQQWGHARVNSYITKGKTYHTADKDLHEEEQLDEFLGLTNAKSKNVKKPKLPLMQVKTFFDKLDKETRIVPQNQMRVRTIAAEETKVTGTNCKNCVFWVKESEKPVGKDELNENGGLKAPNDKYIDMSKQVDLISLPGEATVKIKAFCNNDKVNDFVTERMCCALWDNDEAEREYEGEAEFMEEGADINSLFEMQLIGTDEYRRHAISMTPGQKQEIDDAFPVKDPNKKPVAVPAKKGKSIVSQYEEHTECGTPNCCGECESNGSIGTGNNADNDSRIKEAKEKDGKEDGVDFTPDVNVKKLKKGSRTPGNMRFAYLDGLPVLTARVNEAEELDTSTMSSPPGFSHKSAKPLSKIKKAIKVTKEEKSLTLEEAVQYHLDNNISITENVFRPGSDMFFQLIDEAKRLYKEGKYTPVDEYEQDLLNSDIGEKTMYEGKEVILDFPMAEELNEEEGSDETGGKGIGKPFRSGGGGAVYVKNEKGNIIKVNFSQSGMKKRFMEPGRVRSFVARHHCLTNKDRTSASYWACRWPRYFSNSGKIWW